MAKPRDWLARNQGRVKRVADIISKDLFVNALGFAYISGVPMSGKPSKRAIEPGREEPTSEWQERHWTMAWIFALLLVREADRCGVTLVGEREPLCDWLEKRFFPAYRRSFQRDD